MTMTSQYQTLSLRNEYGVNGFTTTNQLSPEILVLSNGGYVVAYNNTNIANGQILLDFYDADHAKLGPTRSAMTGIFTDAAGKPSLMEMEDGTVVVVWDENLAGVNAVMGASFASDGTPLVTSEPLTGNGLYSDVSVTALAGNDFIVASIIGNQLNLQRQTVGEDGFGTKSFATDDPDGATVGVASDPQVAALADGGFAATWTSTHNGVARILGRVFEDNGDARTGVYTIGEFGQNTQSTIVGLPNGNFAVAYRDTGWGESGVTGAGITVQIFGAQGQNVTPATYIHANLPGTEQESDPDITVLDNGFVVVSWTETTSGGDADIVARIFDQTGNPIAIDGGNLTIRLAGSNLDEALSSLSGGPNGTLISVWQDEESDGGAGRISASQLQLMRATSGDGDDDVFVGDQLRDYIDGGAGNDTIDGGAGDDNLFGHLGADSMTGGEGDDTFYVDEAGDAIVEAAGEGNDVVYAYSSFALTAGAEVETLSTTDVNAAGAIDLAGNEFAQFLHGNLDGNVLDGKGGADTIYGYGGNDTIRGGAGHDLLGGGQGEDVFDFNSVAEIGSADGARDRITDYLPGDKLDLDDIDALTTVAGVQHFTFIGTQNHTGEGATLRYANSGGKTLIEGDVNADGVSDLVIELSGTSLLGADSFTDLTIAAVKGSSAAESLAGGAGAELVSGLGGNDTLSGLAGDDTIRGGGGHDTQTGGSGADVFDFNAVAEIGLDAGARDVIADFEQGVDMIDLDGFDALTTLAGVQHFTWLGTAGHTGAGATLRYAHSGGNTLVYGDVNADGVGDFALQINGVHTLTAADFTGASIASVLGGDAADALVGGVGANAMIGLGGNDTLAGGAGADTMRGGDGADSLTGGDGADRFDFNAVAEIGNAVNARDVIADFQQGVDLIDFDGLDALTTLAGVQHFTWVGTLGHTGAGATLRHAQSGGNTLVFGDVDANGSADFALQLNGLFDLTAADFTNASIATIQGGDQSYDVLTGGPGGKTMLGLGADDTITGGAGADTIYGGAGADLMTGGLGADVFKWSTPGHTGVNAGTRDVITDFQQGLDKIDLNAIDANSTVAGNQDFAFLGTAPHSGAGATLRYQHSGGNTVIFGDVDANGAADFAIQLTGLHTLTAADFVL